MFRRERLSITLRTKLLNRDKGYLFLNFLQSREATPYISEGQLKTFEESNFFFLRLPKLARRLSKMTRRFPIIPEDLPKIFEIGKSSANMFKISRCHFRVNFVFCVINKSTNVNEKFAITLAA